MFSTLGLVIVSVFAIFVALVLIALFIGAFYVIATIEKLEKEHRIERDLKNEIL